MVLLHCLFTSELSFPLLQEGIGEVITDCFYAGFPLLIGDGKLQILTKANVNKRGYNKFLEISKDVQVRINPKKIAEDELWDGLKGYVTNTNLTADEVITQYHGLWVVERAFRISKGNLEMRPMFHFTERRIEAHVCICFVAYKIYKELERIVKLSCIGLSVDKVIEIAKTIISIDIKTDGVKGTARRTLFLTEEQKMIQPLFDIEKLVGHFG